MSDRITIQVATRDRHSEVSLLLQSLRNQTFQDFDLIIADESQTPIQNCHFLMLMIARLQQEGHRVKLVRNDMPSGVCYIRNLLIKNNDFGNKYSAAQALNIGIDKSRAETVVLCHQDIYRWQSLSICVAFKDWRDCAWALTPTRCVVTS
jgi:glycosyltransferase involved in cell wall biosynthesis